VIEPGRLIGDLAVITKDTRKLDLFAAEDCRFLRIGATEYKAVIESDINAALRLLETTAGHLSNAGDRMLSMAQQSAQGGVQDAAGNLGPEPNKD
jgi:putative ABC transport system ATP-binding protein